MENAARHQVLRDPANNKGRCNRHGPEELSALLGIVSKSGFARIEGPGHVAKFAQPVDQGLRFENPLRVDHGNAARGEVDARRSHPAEPRQFGLDLRHRLRAIGLRHEKFDALQARPCRRHPALRIFAFKFEWLEIFAIDRAAGECHGINPFCPRSA